MANEARVTTTLSVRKVSGATVLINHTKSNAFSATVTGTKGPAVGAITVSPFGTTVNLDELSTPGLCTLTNQDAAEVVEYGMYDPEADRFIPFGEILPGESYTHRFSRNFGREYAGSGTGTGSTGPDTNVFMMRSTSEECSVLVEAFEA